jgi:hypothetical protein
MKSFMPGFFVGEAYREDWILPCGFLLPTGFTPCMTFFCKTLQKNFLTCGGLDNNMDWFKK